MILVSQVKDIKPQAPIPSILKYIELTRRHSKLGINTSVMHQKRDCKCDAYLAVLLGEMTGNTHLVVQSMNIHF
jgi:hypothetical protein